MKRGWIFLFALLLINISLASAALVFSDGFDSGAKSNPQNGYQWVWEMDLSSRLYQMIAVMVVVPTAWNFPIQI